MKKKGHPLDMGEDMVSSAFGEDLGMGEVLFGKKKTRKRKNPKKPRSLVEAIEQM